MERADKSRRIARHFFESFDLSNAKLLHCFISIEKFKEVDTSPVIDALWATAPKIQIAVPRVNLDTGVMESLIYTPESGLIENSWGIHEPESENAVNPEAIDVVLVPGLAFDRTGHRVGYGKGFYDRFLKTCKKDCAKIGLSYFEPVNKIEDVHDGDMTVGFCVTPDGVFTPEKRRRED